jgi:hypothetical protein
VERSGPLIRICPLTPPPTTPRDSCNFCVGLAFPALHQLLGPLSFLPFSLVLLLTLAYSYFYLPETAGAIRPSASVVAGRSTMGSDQWKRSGTSLSEMDAPGESAWTSAVRDIVREEERKRESGGYDYGFVVGKGQDNVDNKSRSNNSVVWLDVRGGGIEWGWRNVNKYYVVLI